LRVHGSDFLNGDTCFLDPLADAEAGDVADMSGGPSVDGAASVRGVLGNVGGHPDLPAPGWMKTVAGGRKPRYIGLRRNRAWFLMTGAVYNLIRIAALDAQAA
jgi:hypothetical protein